MRNVFFLLVFAVNFGCAQKSYDDLLKKYYTDFPTISQEKAVAVVGSKNVHFLDTREVNEFNVSHVEDAILFGYDDPNWKAISKLNKSDTIIVYCSIGYRSQKIGEKLKKKGFTHVYNLYGGLFQWSNNEYPLKDAKAKTTKDIHGYSPKWGKWITKGNVRYD